MSTHGSATWGKVARDYWNERLLVLGAALDELEQELELNSGFGTYPDDADWCDQMDLCQEQSDEFWTTAEMWEVLVVARNWGAKPAPPPDKSVKAL